MGIIYWTPPIYMDNPSMDSLWFIMLLLAILTFKGFLDFFHINSENNNILPKQIEEPLSM